MGSDDSVDTLRRQRDEARRAAVSLAASFRSCQDFLRMENNMIHVDAGDELLRMVAQWAAELD